MKIVKNAVEALSEYYHRWVESGVVCSLCTLRITGLQRGYPSKHCAALLMIL